MGHESLVLDTRLKKPQPLDRKIILTLEKDLCIYEKALSAESENIIMEDIGRTKVNPDSEKSYIIKQVLRNISPHTSRNKIRSLGSIR